MPLLLWVDSLITNLGMSFARCTNPKGQDVVRALFFHVIGGATDERFTDSWTKRTTKEKTHGAMLDDAEVYLDNHFKIIEGCCDTEGEDVVKEVAGYKEKKKRRDECTRTRAGFESCHKR